MTAERDDRRKLNRDAAGAQPPAPVERPTPPEQLPSRSWTEVKTDKWLLDLVNRPRDVVARALYEALPGDTIVSWTELPPDDELRTECFTMADAALDAVAPLLRAPTFRSMTARRDAELANALRTVDQLNDFAQELQLENVKLDAKLQRYRESVRAMAKIIQRKRAGANRQVEYYKRQWRIAQELLRRRQS